MKMYARLQQIDGRGAYFSIEANWFQCTHQGGWCGFYEGGIMYTDYSKSKIIAEYDYCEFFNEKEYLARYKEEYGHE